MIHAKLLDYLRAGTQYAAAYRPAFYTAKHALISRVRVPATLMRWEGKPDLAEVDELIGRGLPPNFTVLRAGPSMDERLAVNEQHLLTHYLPTGVAPPPPVPQLRNRSPDVERLFFDLPAASILAHANTVGTGRPLLRPRLGSRHGAEDSAHRDDRVAAF